MYDEDDPGVRNFLAEQGSCSSELCNIVAWEMSCTSCVYLRLTGFIKFASINQL